MESKSHLGTLDTLIVVIEYKTEKKLLAPAFGIIVFDKNNNEIFRLSTFPISGFFIDEINGKGAVELNISSLPLLSGTYYLSVYVSRANIDFLLKIDEVATFNVEPRDVYKSGFTMDNLTGSIVVPHVWRLIN